MCLCANYLQAGLTLISDLIMETCRVCYLQYESEEELAMHKIAEHNNPSIAPDIDGTVYCNVLCPTNEHSDCIECSDPMSSNRHFVQGFVEGNNVLFTYYYVKVCYSTV
jgi:hypothetical protein